MFRLLKEINSKPRSELWPNGSRSPFLELFGLEYKTLHPPFLHNNISLQNQDRVAPSLTKQIVCATLGGQKWNLFMSSFYRRFAARFCLWVFLHKLPFLEQILTLSERLWQRCVYRKRLCRGSDFGAQMSPTRGDKLGTVTSHLEHPDAHPPSLPPSPRNAPGSGFSPHLCPQHQLCPLQPKLLLSNDALQDVWVLFGGVLMPH